MDALFAAVVVCGLLVALSPPLVALTVAMRDERRRTEATVRVVPPRPRPSVPQQELPRRWRVEILARLDDEPFVHPVGAGVVVGPWRTRDECEREALRQLVDHLGGQAVGRVGVRAQPLGRVR